MDNRMRRLAAAGTLVGFLTVGGYSLASAQEDPTTTTTEDATVEDDTATTAPDDSAPDDREGCPKAEDRASSSETEVEAS